MPHNGQPALSLDSTRQETARLALFSQKEREMFSAADAFPIFAFGAFALFGCVLAWASWMEGREAKNRKEPLAER